jgi:hypothetical protein
LKPGFQSLESILGDDRVGLECLKLRSVGSALCCEINQFLGPLLFTVKVRPDFGNNIGFVSNTKGTIPDIYGVHTGAFVYGYLTMIINYHTFRTNVVISAASPGSSGSRKRFGVRLHRLPAPLSTDIILEPSTNNTQFSRSNFVWATGPSRRCRTVPSLSAVPIVSNTVSTVFRYSSIISGV